MASSRHFVFCIIHMICLCQQTEAVKKGNVETGVLPKVRLTVQPVSHNALQVSWAHSSNINDDQLSFRLIFSPVNSPYKRRTYLELPGSYRVFIINGLLPASHYRIKMSVMWNNKGKIRIGPYTPWTVASTLHGIPTASRFTTPISRTVETPTSRTIETPTSRTVETPTSRAIETSTPTTEYEEEIPLQPTPDPTCQEVTVPMCRGLVYNHTRMPNSLNHTTQAEAKLEIYQYFILAQTKCSPVIRFFLCSVFTPICIPEHNKVLPPCRSVCEAAWRGCQSIMKRYHISWPGSLDCKQFPDVRDPSLCMDHKDTTSAVTLTDKKSTTVPRTDSTTASIPLTFPPMRATKCRKHRIPLCKEMYVKARFPNLLGHRRHEAGEYISVFTPLVRYNCSPYLRDFLCILLAPPCTGNKTPVLPCRSLCNRTRNGCEHIMRRFKFSWPREMDCSRFPPDDGSELCAAPAKKCKPVPVPKCQRLYNFTTERAVINTRVSRGNPHIDGFSVVLKAADRRCKKLLQYFLCLRQYPKCTEQHQQIVPCRSLCRKVQKRCGTEMKKHGITFAADGVSSPDFPDCKVFPQDKGNIACSASIKD